MFKALTSSRACRESVYQEVTMYFLVLLSILVSIEVSGAPPRDMVMPRLEFDLYHIKTPQLIGIIIGIIVFTTTIGVVIYLLHASGTLTNAWKEIVVDAKNAATVNFPGITQITSPFHSQPELYDHLLAAKENLPKRFDVGIITGKSVTLRLIISNNDFQLLFEASNGSAQYHESAYDLAKVWGWQDVDISSCIGRDNSVNQPWSSVTSFKNWIALQEEEGVAHIVIEDNEYRKPIGLISVSNHRVRNLSINIEYTWLTPAFQGLHKAHESYFLLLDHLFKLGYRRVTAETDERNVVGRKLLQKCGFQFETVLRKHKVIQKRNSNTALYVVLNSEWQEIMPKLSTKFRPEKQFEK